MRNAGWNQLSFLQFEFPQVNMQSITLRLLRATAFCAISAAFLICSEARAEAEIDLGSRNTVSLVTNVLWPKEYGLYLLLQKHVGLANELRKSGYDVSLLNNSSEDPGLLTFTVKIYKWGDRGDELVFEQSNLLPNLIMSRSEEFGLEVASAQLPTGRYRIEATPENTNHALADIPARLMFIKALRGK
ncbi:hypothetical protein K3552_01005 [Leisingera aquaemixtae]|uniref:hypothetical protein n=1 Tax=Leisingera aquaemixtae TaxID=1396826 RepID=UPI0021A68A86|nr:hypothetical protein [Leisingera aquaemixtae]UWQ37615.1 hypothetical protein K3552_01005 [Leisingera aquaemixtae]